MSEKGFRVTHTYGLSETYGPSTICVWKPEWNSLPPEQQARLNARQGVRYIALEHLDVNQGPSKDIIISGGENISSVEIENVLYTHPAVAGGFCGRLGPDERWGIPVRVRDTEARFRQADSQRMAEDIMKFCGRSCQRTGSRSSVFFGHCLRRQRGRSRSIFWRPGKGMGPVKKSKL
ncbi:hypothetical protein MLD38_017963 [Melastoma candidum]|uniref:Uncharacterized protein n=1 Tax=Melastoma candidum TaxID=119954 RepID=A0ACB9QSD7_9MYRT|nr:hypothetical protein MLD38_017963 [Melastoma candidum]